jgi:EmrB/QacA subfamily drug resistance transporter
MSQDVLAPPRSDLADAVAPPTERAGWIVPAIIGSALLMQSLESTVMSNALPAIAHALHEEPLRLNMAITMFLLASAVFLPVSGWVADKFGAKRIFLASMVLFALSSAGCGFAHSLPQLILARIAQGASAAMMVPVGRIVLLRMTPKTELVAAMSIFTMPAMIGPLVGPLLGGFIVTYFDWRWIFFINLPIAAVAVVLVRAFVPDIKEHEVSPIDWLGLGLTAIGLASLMFGFENLGRNFLPAWEVAGLFAVAAVSFGLYWRHAAGNRHAIIDLAVFRIRTFNASTIGGGFLRISLGAMPFLLAMLLQVGFGLSAFAAGMMTFISSTGAFVMKTVAPPILRSFGFRAVLLANGGVTALTFAVYALFTPTMPHWEIMAILVVGSFFRSLQFTALNSLTYADIDQPQMSRAATTSAICQQVLQSLGVGLAATMLHFMQLARGESELTWQTVSPAFVAVGLVSLISLAWFVRLPRNAGDEMSGRAAV